MSYTLRIGNAVIEEPYEHAVTAAAGNLDGGERPEWGMTVNLLELPEAPVFPGDFASTAGPNERSPSYAQWMDFANATGLADFFYEEGAGFLWRHPGVFPIYEFDWQRIHDVKERWYAEHGKAPGWNPESDPMARGQESSNSTGRTVAVLLRTEPEVEADLDPIYARLVWLDWWMRWALDNCERPAFCNW